jgi:hypothetical protein
VHSDTRLVVLRVSRTLDAGDPHNLFFACVQTSTRVYACGVSIECVGCVRQIIFDKKKRKLFDTEKLLLSNLTPKLKNLPYPSHILYFILFHIPITFFFVFNGIKSKEKRPSYPFSVFFKRVVFRRLHFFPPLIYLQIFFSPERLNITCLKKYTGGA